MSSSQSLARERTGLRRSIGISSDRCSATRLLGRPTLAKAHDTPFGPQTRRDVLEI